MTEAEPGLTRRARGRFLRWLAALVLLALVVVVLYALADQILGRVPVNADFRNAPDGIPVVVRDNGIHVDFLLPIRAGGHDWRDVFDTAPTRFGPNLKYLATHVEIGWGHRDFYVNTPTWDDLTAKTVGKAVFGIGGSVLHITFAIAPDDDPATSVTLFLTPDAYRRLVARIAGTAVVGKDGMAVALSAPGYGDRDAFYVATGSYSALYTCNNWAASVIADAGVRAPLWSPFSGGVMAHLRQVGALPPAR